MSMPDETTYPAQPAYSVEVTFYRIRGSRREDPMTVTARGPQTFVTRLAEAAASAFEEETTQ
ncbi:hypothetical protein ACFXJ6_07955 [Streptomyces sp. NPDC059218]|uniref:hypothetical protein n=1 Tax=unclassified Streptomyces TaxID=2593676 RepID=UPI0036C74C8B